MPSLAMDPPAGIWQGKEEDEERREEREEREEREGEGRRASEFRTCESQAKSAKEVTHVVRVLSKEGSADLPVLSSARRGRREEAHPRTVASVAFEWAGLGWFIVSTSAETPKISERRMNSW